MHTNMSIYDNICTFHAQVMSVQSLSPFRSILKKNFFGFFIRTKEFSRRSIDVDEPYKVVKSREVCREEKSFWKWNNPNYEYFASNTYPFFMNGNVGPAWYDKQSSLELDSSCRFIMQEIPRVKSDVEDCPGITCQVQTCPKLLRQTVSHLFPYRDFESSDLTVLTITIKPEMHLLRNRTEIETEKLAQIFLLTAKCICTRIRKVSYWADFINPFSGRPYFSSTKGNDLYETDERFRCLDFKIFEMEKCLIISNEQTDISDTHQSFVGSLFATVPTDHSDLTNIFLYKF